MQALVVDAVYVSQGKLTISGGGVVYQRSYSWRLRLLHGLINKWEPQLARRKSSLQIYRPQRIVLASDRLV